MKAVLLDEKGVVVNYIVVESEEWVKENLPEYAADDRHVITDDDKYVSMGFSHDSEKKEFIAPEPEVVSPEVLAKADLDAKQAKGLAVIDEFLLFAHNLPDKLALETLAMAGPVVQALQLGLLKIAAGLLQSLPASDVLDAEMAPGITVKQAFIGKIID